MYACIKCWFSYQIRHMMFESNFLTDPNSKIFKFRDSFNICTITSGDNLIIVTGIFFYLVKIINLVLLALRTNL